MVAGIEILKSLLYDGHFTYGITVWLILSLMMAIIIILYLYGQYRMIFGRKRWIRRLITSGVRFSKVRFSLSEKVDDVHLINAVKEAFITGVSDFDRSIDLRGDLGG